jgi:hypothetical protein
MEWARKNRCESVLILLPISYIIVLVVKSSERSSAE